MDNSYNAVAKSITDNIIFVRRERLSWLLELDIEANSLVNFGCNIGGETLALMYFLEANEGVGLDRSATDIQQARSSFSGLKECIQYVERYIKNYPQWTPDNIKDWLDNLPEYFKDEILNDSFSLEYLEQDITVRSELSSNHFDLAFCDFVLHHIWYGKGELNRNDTLSAIQEMVRVVKPSGIVAAYELIQYDDKPKLDFIPLFEQVGLELVNVNEREGAVGERHYIVGEYCYRKQQS